MMATQSEATMIATDKMIPMLIALRLVALPPSLFPPPLLLPPITCVCCNTFCSHSDHNIASCGKQNVAI